MAAKLKKPHFSLKNAISMNDFSCGDIEAVLSLAKRLESKPRKLKSSALKEKIIAALFFEPSTRTRLSFEAAAFNLGANVLSVSEAGFSSVKKGESLEDTIKTVALYSDVIVVRSPQEKAALKASKISRVPVINAGSGSDEHPTQALTDLFAIKKRFGKLSRLKIGMLGDLKHGRTVHSLALALAKFPKNRFYFIAPKGLEMPSEILKRLKGKSIVSSHSSIEKVLPGLDILYVTRLQRERFSSAKAFKRFEKAFIVKPSSLKNAKKSLAVMHPLPRTNELPASIDSLPYAYYFEQAACGVPVREALLMLLCNKKRG